LARRVACGGCVARFGVGPAVLQLAALRAGQCPLLDLSAEWAAAEAAQILDPADLAGGASSAGPHAFGPRPQLVRAAAPRSL
jgi:hypothetical protein